MQKREQLAKELAGNKTKYMEREKQREEERCLNCIHREVCDEINKLPCREQFVWYKGETGCPHHLTAVELANAVMLAKTLFPESFGEKKRNIVRMQGRKDRQNEGENMNRQDRRAEAREKANRYRRAMAAWYQQEPPRWRLIAWFKWRARMPR